MSNRLHLGLIMALGLHGSFVSCTSTVAPSTVVKAARRSADAGPSFESPARWAAFPQDVGIAMAAMKLDGGGCLVTTQDGQRWLVTPTDEAKPCIGRGRASGSPTFEPLVGAQRVGDEFRFIAEGGSIYTSKEANGPFSRYVRAPTYLRHVTARGAAIVGLDDAGGTYFYDGAEWNAAAVPKGSRGIDVAADDRGRVLWIGAPESLLISVDAGRTFSAPSSALPHIGAHEAGFTVSGKLAVRGALGSFAWEADGVRPTTEKLLDVAVPDVEIEPAQGPRSSAVMEQRAAIDATQYLELIESEDIRWSLAKSTLGGLPETMTLEELDACENVKLASAGGLIAFGCSKQVPDQINVSAEIYLSKDGGSTLELVTTLWTPTNQDMTLALAPDGTLMTLGACKPTTPKASAPDTSAKDAGAPHNGPADDERDAPTLCTPKGPIVLRNGTLASGSVPYLEEASARSPILSRDGRSAYFLGRNRKDSMPAVFVSRDGGHTYHMRTIEPPQSSSWDEGDTAEMDGGVRPLYLAETSALTIDETGTLGIVAERDVGLSWLTLDAEGRIANVGEPPEPSFMIGGFGSRVLALGYGQMDGAMKTWESVDGGITWAEITSTPAVQRYGESGGAFVCGQGGCILGEELARIGWEGQAEAPFSMTEELFPTTLEPKLSVSLGCQLVAKSEWVPIEGRPEERATRNGFVATGSSPSMPRLREILRGKTLWSVATVGDDGAIGVTMVNLSDKEGAAPSLSTKALLGARKSPKNGLTATTVRAQSEGYVALRASVPFAKSGGFDTSKRMEGLEVAWQNQYTGTFSKKQISFDAHWNAAVVTGAMLRPNLLTLASQGVVVQPSAGAKATYLDGQQSLVFDYPNLATLVTDGREVGATDAIYLGGRPFAVVVADRTPTANVVITAPSNVAGKGNGASTTSAPAALTLAPATTEIDWMYGGDQVGLVAFFGAPNQDARASAVGFMFAPDGTLGPAMELPTLADLADRPQPCSAEDRKKTPRTVSPHFGTTGALMFEQGRRVIMVTDAASTSATSGFATAPIEPIWLLTDGAILHGTKKDPCLAAWRASGIRPGYVAVVGGNPEHAWLIRQTSGMSVTQGGASSGSRWNQRLEARPMVCRYQPDLAVPYEIASRGGQRMADDQP